MGCNQEDGTGSSRDTMSMDTSQHEDSPREDTPPIVRRQPFHICVLTRIHQIVVKNYYKRNALHLLQMRNYAHVKHFEPTLLARTRLGWDMQQAFKKVGCTEFHHITEQGSSLLTMEFLLSLKAESNANETSISF